MRPQLGEEEDRPDQEKDRRRPRMIRLFINRSAAHRIRHATIECIGNLKDETLADLFRLVQEQRDDSAPRSQQSPGSTGGNFFVTKRDITWQ
jgi:hypothetical protein